MSWDAGAVGKLPIAELSVWVLRIGPFNPQLASRVATKSNHLIVVLRVIMVVPVQRKLIVQANDQ